MAYDFFATLEKEHEEVLNLLEQLEGPSCSAQTNSSPNPTDPFDQLKLKLISQMKGEEQRFHALLSHIKMARNEGLGSFEERNFAELVLKELERLDEGPE